MMGADLAVSELQNFRGLNGEFIMDTLEEKPSYLIVGKNGSQVRVSSSAYRLLQAVNSGMSLDELAQMLNKRNAGEQVTKEQLEEAYHNLLEKLVKIEDRAANRQLPWGFWVRFCLVPKKIAARIALLLSILYHPYAVVLFIAAIAAGAFSAFHQGIKLELNDAGFISGYLLFLFSLIIHEFGHAAACARYGALPSDIGFTIYLIYPAFYSDVSSAWQLTRWQRVAVDLGGNYFQFIVGTGFLGAFYITHWEPLRLATIMIVSAAVFSLNPIFKFDGYWVIADLLGVTNLTKQPVRIGKYFYDRLLKRPTAPLPWPMLVTSILIVYSLISVFVWALFLWRVLPLMAHRSILFIHHLNVIGAQVASGGLPPWSEWRTFMISLFFLIIGLVMLWQMAKQFGRPTVRWASSFFKRVPKHP